MGNTWNRSGGDDFRAPRATGRKYDEYDEDGADGDEDFDLGHLVRPVRGAKIYEQTRKTARKNTNKRDR